MQLHSVTLREVTYDITVLPFIVRCDDNIKCFLSEGKEPILNQTNCMPPVLIHSGLIHRIIKPNQKHSMLDTYFAEVMVTI